MFEASVVNALGTGLFAVIEKLLEKGVIDPALESGLETLRNWIVKGYNKAKNEEVIRKTLLDALDETREQLGNLSFDRLYIVNKLTNLSAEEHKLLAAAAMELVYENPHLISLDVIDRLDVAPDKIPLLTKFLFNYRKRLLNVEGFGWGILYYNQLYSNGKINSLSSHLSLLTERISRIDNIEKILSTERRLAADDKEALENYLNVVRQQLRFAPLPMVRSTPGFRADAEIKQIYVPLKVKPQKTSVALSIGEMLRNNPRFILIGSPGSGKTTALRKIALSFAEGLARDDFHWNKSTFLLPIYIRLRNLDNFYEENKKNYTTPSPGLLTAYLDHYFRDEYRLNLTAKFFDDRLNEGNCLVLMDGVDEISQNRFDIAQNINLFIQHYVQFGNRFGLSSRPKGFDAVELQLRRSYLSVFEVLPLDLFSIQSLVEKLISVIDENPIQRAKDFKGLTQVIQNSKHLIQIAGNPLFATALVLVYKYHGAELPQRRVDVFQEIIDLLLGFWKAQEQELVNAQELGLVDGTGVVFRDLRAAVSVKKRRLAHLAYYMQKENLREISSNKAAEILAQYLQDKELVDIKNSKVWSEEFLLNSHERSGLFVESEPGLYSFIHEGFREYLAATALINLREEEFLEVFLHNLDNDQWEQVLLLASAHSELSEATRSYLVSEILREISQQKKDQKKESLWQHTAIMAGKIATDMSEYLIGNDRKNIETLLCTLMTSDEILTPNRIRFGEMLNNIGWIPPQLYELISVKTEQQDNEFWISKYPVTNIQYQRFLESPDYEDQSLWSNLVIYNKELDHEIELLDNGWDWYQQNRDKATGKVYPKYWFDPTFGAVNRCSPVVGVSWFEAMAYCKWLKKNWSICEEAGANEVKPKWIRMPTEKEWLLSAGCEVTSKRYPWDLPGQLTSSNSEISKRANLSGILNRTTNVGMYPLGNSNPFGLVDLAGNVNEWQSNLFDDVHNWAVIKGGSFQDYFDKAMCDYQFRRELGQRHSTRGFRIIIQSK